MLQINPEWRCYYTIARYVADPFRDEPRNIGVIVLCPDQHFAGCKFHLGWSGLRRESPRYRLLDVLIQEYSAQLPGDLLPKQGEVWTVDRITELHDNSTDMLQFTAPVPALGDPSNLLSNLFRSRVKPARTTPAERRKKLARRAMRAFEEAIQASGRGETIRANPSVHIDGVGYRFDLGIQNGNLQYTIDTLSFTGSSVQHSEERAAWYSRMWRPIAQENRLHGIVLYEAPTNQSVLQTHFQQVIDWVSSAEVAVHDIKDVDAVATDVVSRLEH